MSLASPENEQFSECVYTFLNPLLSCHECMFGNLLLSLYEFQQNRKLSNE